MAQSMSALGLARAQLASLTLARPASLAQLRGALSAWRGMHIGELDSLTGHGIWLDTAGITLVFTSTDPGRQLHDLAHVLLGHQPNKIHSPTMAPVDHLRGRATEGRINGFTPHQEDDADLARPVLTEFLAP